MIVVNRQIYEACRELVARDREVGFEVRAVLAMALAAGGGNIRAAAAILHGACVVAQLAAGEALEDVIRDTRELREMAEREYVDGAEVKLS